MDSCDETAKGALRPNKKNKRYQICECQWEVIQTCESLFQRCTSVRSRRKPGLPCSLPMGPKDRGTSLAKWIILIIIWQRRKIL